MIKLSPSVVVAWLLALPGPLAAQTVLSVGSVPAFPGGTASVPVSLRLPGDRVVAAQFDAAYNPSKVNAGPPVPTARLAGHTIRSREVAPGVWRTLVYSLGNNSVPGTNGPLVRIPFTVSPQETVGSGPVTSGHEILARADGTALALESRRSGEIFVRPVNLLPDGSAQFFLPSTNDQRYVIQATTNLVHWVTIATNSATSEFLNATDAQAREHPYRFYRWQLLTP